MKPIIAIYGPTHTGKTNLAAEFFSRHPSEIISVDSVQIYREADIGSNKPDNLFLKENGSEKIYMFDCLKFWGQVKNFYVLYLIQNCRDAFFGLYQHLIKAS